jgi:hypothetical protein
MLEEATRKYPALRELTCDGIQPNIVSFVYCPEHTNTIFLFATDEVSMDILVHECTHVVMRIFECIGAELKEPSEEFFAYYMEMIFRDVLSIFKKRCSFTPKLPLI